VLVAGASAKSLRTYHIGCSTTDNTTQCADPTNYARSLGDTHHWAKCTQLGCGMECVYINTLINGNRLHELSDSSWDGVVCASYPNGAHLGVAVDLAYSDSCYQQALKKNPNCILYLSGVWTYNVGKPWEYEWLNTTAKDYEPDFHANYTSKKWHEDYIKAAQAKFGASRARLLPFAHAMSKVNDWVKSGKTNVVSSVYQLYFDSIHLNEKGA